MNCFECHNKCKAECCSDLTPLPKGLIDKHQEKVVNCSIEKKEVYNESVINTTGNGRCIFLREDMRCNIYDDRPELCRKFGDETHPMLFCSWQSKEGRVRSRQEKRKIERQAKDWVNKFDIWAKKIHG